MFANAKRQKSVIVLIASSFWLGYVLFSCYQYYQSASRSADTVIEGRKISLNYVLDSSVNPLANDNTAVTLDQLKTSQKSFLIDFYILQKGPKVLGFFNNAATPDSLNVNYTRFNQLIETDELSFKSIKVFDYTLTVGIVTSKALVLKKIIRADIFLILKDIFTVTALLSVLLFLYLRDILSLSKILSGTNRSSLAQVKSLSREGTNILRAASSLEGEQMNLQNENRQFSNTITPAILAEMKSGKKPPYSFRATIIRVDLNGYTQIFLDKKDEYITKILNQYFKMARDIIERYDGFIYQFVGDEIVFQIKEDRGNSQALAISCVRSLFEAALVIEKNLPFNAGHAFKLKACFTTGRMRFVPLDTGYGLSGLPLIETARLLNQVEEKSKNMVCFFMESYPEFKALCEIDFVRDARFKGFQSQTSVAQSSQFHPVDHFLTTDHYQQLTYFRSDSDLQSVSKYLEKLIQEKQEEESMQVLSVVRDIKSGTCSPELSAQMTRVLVVAYEKNKAADVSARLLCSMMTVVSRWVPKEAVTEEALQIFHLCLAHTNHRACANAIVALSEYSDDRSFLREYIHSSNNRISADALIALGKVDFDKELLAKIESYIQSRNSLFRASGLYIGQELIRHYSELNPVYLQTNEQMRRLKFLFEQTKAEAA